MRDDFTERLKEQLAHRAGNTCSNPDCRALTSGPKIDVTGTINLGVAAHITAAAAGGPRYDSSLSSERRCNIDNGIWLCQNCAKLIDSDPQRFSVSVLREWKRLAEQVARELVGKAQSSPSQEEIFVELEGLIPQLLSEMRQDLTDNLLMREFVLLDSHGNVYNGGPILIYYREDHQLLDQQLRILENHGFITNITWNNVDRYVMSEDLAKYFLRGR